MAKTSELETLQQICRKAGEKRQIKESEKRRLLSAFGQRFARAWEAVENQRVKKYLFTPSNRVVWIVVGKERDYLMWPAADYCSCDDFYFRVMDKQAHLCYHLIALKLAKSLESYDPFQEEDELYESLMEEWKRAML